MSAPPNPSSYSRQLLTPGDIPLDADGTIQWWTPHWRGMARHMGWRWLYFVPVALIVLVLAIFAWDPVTWQIFFYGIKLWAILIALAIGAAAQGIRQGIKHRRDPFCIHCGYSLDGLPDHHRCPECGRPYAKHLIDEYRRDPRWFIERWRTQQATPPNVTIAARPSKRKSRDGT